MIEELPSQRLACRFTHEIVRRALYDRLSRLRRAELHLSVGEALEGTADAASDRALADLAHHFGAAAPFGGAKRAIEYNLRAARAASAALAFDDAATRLGTALEIGIEDEPERAARPARARLRPATGPARRPMRWRPSRRRRRSPGGWETPSCWRGRRSATRRPAGARGREPGAIELLEEALTAVGDGERRVADRPACRARPGARLQGERERGAIVRENAVALARRARRPPRAGQGPGPLLLGARHDAAGGDPAMLTEARDWRGAGRPEAQTEAIAWRVPTFVALGDLDAARGRSAPCGRWPSGPGSRS